MRKGYILMVTYKGEVDNKLDEQIGQVLGGVSKQAGVWLIEGGIRDLEYTYPTKKAANNAWRRLRKIKRYKELEVDICEVW